MQEKKTRCRYCKVEILATTAERTNGFCMPHAQMGMPFKQQIGGIVEHTEEVNPSQITMSGVSEDFRLGIGVEWDELLKKMTSKDRLVRFHTRPSSPTQPSYAATGYAIIRNDDEWIDGIVTEWRSNEAYYEDVEEVLWNDPRAGDTLVHFTTSPWSWASLCGREGYAVKRQGKYVAFIVTVLN